jgi:hypothetical protein
MARGGPVRNYGRFTTSIWQDSDFTSLTQPLQAVYFTLGLQPDVTAAGTLALTVGRWAKLSAGVTRGQLLEQVQQLCEHAGRHLVIDEDTEELLIRKFMKWDQGWSNSKRLPVVIDAVSAISSVHIRDIAVDELHRLAASPATSDEQKRSRDALSHALTAFDRLRVTLGDHIPEPHSATHDPEPESLLGEPPDASAGPPSMFCSKHPDGTEKPCGPCGTAKLRYAAWVKSTAGREAERRAQKRLEQTNALVADIAQAKAAAVSMPSDLRAGVAS